MMPPDSPVSAAAPRQLSDTDKAELLSLVKENVNIQGLAGGALKKVLRPALERAVLKTKTPLDDMALSALYPTLESYVLAELGQVLASAGLR